MVEALSCFLKRARKERREKGDEFVGVWSILGFKVRGRDNEGVEVGVTVHVSGSCLCRVKA